MNKKKWQVALLPWDERRNIALANDYDEAIGLCYENFIDIAEQAIKSRNHFHVALSGGSTPLALYKLLAKGDLNHTIDWQKVSLYWSDERYVPANSKDNNFFSAMQAGIKELPIPQNQIYPFNTSIDIEESAKAYEKILREKTSGYLDLVILGMGEDGHTASLFPNAKTLEEQNHLALADTTPRKSMQRLTLTFSCINQAKNIVIYVLGKDKAAMVKEALTGPFNPKNIPIQNVGTDNNKALWIMDYAAASEALKSQF